VRHRAKRLRRRLSRRAGTLRVCCILGRRWARESWWENKLGGRHAGAWQGLRAKTERKVQRQKTASAKKRKP